MARDIVGSNSMEVSEDQLLSIGDCRNFLLTRFPGFDALKSFSIALNETYAEDTETLKEGDVVAIIPPVSGG